MIHPLIPDEISPGFSLILTVQLCINLGNIRKFAKEPHSVSMGVDVGLEEKHFGNLGESFARGYLQREGFSIRFAPFRCRSGEIDIIATEGETLVFIEVKTRRSLQFGSPIEAVNEAKRRQILKVARFFIAQIQSVPFRFCRFDVLGIVQGPSGTEPVVTHIRDAFRDESRF